MAAADPIDLTGIALAQKIYVFATLLEKRSLSAQFDRLTFEAEAFDQFPMGCEGGYIKLLFNADGSAMQSQPESDAPKPVVRSFTVVEFDGQRLAIDIVKGKDSGVASNWTDRVKPGEHIMIASPGKSQPLPSGYDSYFIVGDETAIPAIMVQLNQTKDASGISVLQGEKQVVEQLEVPDTLHLHQVDRAIDGPKALVNTVIGCEWPDGRVYVWAACEFDQMRALRRYFRWERNVAKADMYISSYWKQGETDEGNKRAKKMDSEADL